MDIEKLILAAQHHGEDSEPDHEVGDLQELLRACWSTMTPKAKRAVFAACGDDMLEWLREDADAVVTPPQQTKRQRCPKCGSSMHRCKTGTCLHCDNAKCEHVLLPRAS